MLQGDRDDVTLEHGAAALADGRLAVLPGTTRGVSETPGIVNMLVSWFLRGAVPASGDWTGRNGVQATQFGRPQRTTREPRTPSAPT